MSTQKHLIRIATVSFLFVVLMGSNTNCVAKEKHHRIHNTILEHKKKVINRVKNVKSVVSNHKLMGIASFYGYESGNRTASGSRFNPLGLSAAHRTLPLNSMVKVTNLKNNKSVVLKINDRGPYVKGRIIDLSLGAARTIGLNGVGKVSIELL